MAEEGFKRKLTAILSADVEGYSRLMDDDEEATVRTLTSYRTAIADLVQQYRGRVVDSPGDNILAEFTSVVDAVNCAVEIQRDLAERNTELNYERQMQFRIGVNLGDVIEEEGRIYGDGVNIAARVESLAEAGGICISGRAYDQVANKLGLEYYNLGKHQVKNISTPIRVYRVLSYPGAAAHRVVQAKKTLGRKWRKIGFSAAAIVALAAVLGIWQLYTRRPAMEPAAEEQMAFPLPEKPSVAVLRFDYMGDDPDKEYIADALSENIIIALSKIPDLFVIAKESSFSYKGKDIKIKQISEELGVRYVLEGSLQKSGDHIRVTAQLINAIKGYHVWSDSYDRKLKDFFTLQDDILLNILDGLQVELTIFHEGFGSGTTSPEALFKVYQGLNHVYKYTREGIIVGRKFYKEAIELDPGYAWAYNLLGWTYFHDAIRGFSKSKTQSLQQAEAYANKALELNPSLGEARGQLAVILGFRRQYEEAIAEGERALDMDPNNAAILALHTATLNSFKVGRYEEALALIERAIRINPKPASYYFVQYGLANMGLGRYEKAIEVFKNALSKAPKNMFAWMNLAICYVLTDKVDEAEKAAAEVLKVQPAFCIDLYKKTFSGSEETDRGKLYIGALRKAGLSEKPPLPLPDKPSIAVLAFDNLSGDPKQEYFSDGIAENIITALSKVGELFVIARNSSFTYKGKPVKIQQIGRQLGVRYVLEGSVRRSGDRLRITAQLIDAKNGQHLWAENYDRDFKDIFEMQDEITMKIVTELRVELTLGEQARILAKTTNNPEVFLKTIRLHSLWNDGTKESLIRFGQLAQEIVEAEPESPTGYRALGWYHWGLAGKGESPRDNFSKAFKFGQKALALDESDAFTNATLGNIYLLTKNYDKAIELGKRSVELLPNGAIVHCLFGSTLSYAGRVDEAIVHIKQAIRLNPFPAYYYYYHLGRCYAQKGLYEDALTEFKKAVQRAPDLAFIYAALAGTYILSDREEEAHNSTAKALELNPNLSVTGASKTMKYKNQAYTEQILDALRKAGFPE
jgi:adenylate cyclase